MSRHRAHEPERRPGDGVSPYVAIASLVCVVMLAAAMFFMAGSDRVSRPMNINGDMVGIETGETVADYAERAAKTLEDPPPLADGSEASRRAPHWALVSFDPAVDAQVAAAAVDNIHGLRVSVLYAGQIVSRPLPEPTEGATRADVIDRELGLIRRAAGPGVQGNDPVGVTGLLVRGTVLQLRGIQSRPGVVAVEALPADAVAGRFGVRPLPLQLPGPNPVPDESPGTEAPAS